MSGAHSSTIKTDDQIIEAIPPVSGGAIAESQPIQEYLELSPHNESEEIEEPPKTINPEDSILTSVKKLLGLTEENEEFDLDIMMNINGAISILTQIGVGPSTGFFISSKNDTYEDWLGDMKLFQNVKMYLYYKTRLGFDPPTSASVIEVLKDQIMEAECRLSYLVDPGGEIQNE